MKVVRLSASRNGRLYPLEMFLVLIFTRGSVDSQGHGTFGRNMSPKNPVTPRGFDPVRLVAQHLNHYATPGPLYIYNIFLMWGDLLKQLFFIYQIYKRLKDGLEPKHVVVNKLITLVLCVADLICTLVICTPHIVPLQSTRVLISP
jgi:hypothetical protein